MGWNQMWIKIWPRKKLYLMTGYSSVCLFFCLPHLLVCWWTKFFCYGFWTFLQKPGCFACSICCHSFHSLRAFFLFLTFLFPCFWFFCFARSICWQGFHSLLAINRRFCREMADMSSPGREFKFRPPSFGHTWVHIVQNHCIGTSTRFFESAFCPPHFLVGNRNITRAGQGRKEPCTWRRKNTEHQYTIDALG